MPPRTKAATAPVPEVEPKKTRGRPKKTTTTASPKLTPHSPRLQAQQAVAQKSTRGRPKKTVVAPATEDKETHEESDDEEPTPAPHQPSPGIRKSPRHTATVAAAAVNIDDDEIKLASYSDEEEEDSENDENEQKENDNDNDDDDDLDNWLSTVTSTLQNKLHTQSSSSSASAPSSLTSLFASQTDKVFTKHSGLIQLTDTQKRTHENALNAIGGLDKITAGNDVTLPSLNAAKERKEKKKNAPDTAGPQWFGLTKPTMTPELKKDLKLLQLRNYLDPKKFFKKEKKKGAPKYFQIGTVVHSAADYYSSRAESRGGFVDDILADQQSRSYLKRTFLQIQETKRPEKKHFTKKRKGTGGTQKKR